MHFVDVEDLTIKTFDMNAVVRSGRIGSIGGFDILCTRS